MITKEDWRMQEDLDLKLLKNLQLKRINFPDFWQKSYNEKNIFYQKILEDARSFVNEHHRGEEFLEGEKVQAFWHEHCYFCWKTFMTNMDVQCYCSQDYGYWICSTCLEDFKDKFNFSITE